MKTIGKIILAFFVFLLIGIVVLIYLLFSNNDTGQGGSDVPPEPPKEVGDLLGNEDIVERRPVLTPPRRPLPLDDTPPVFELPETPEDGTTPPAGTSARLVRLFPGPTAGYRIDKTSGGEWIVKVVGQGKGNRHNIRTVPYASNLVSTGEFSKVLESHIFACLLYTSPSPRD